MPLGEQSGTALESGQQQHGYVKGLPPQLGVLPWNSHNRQIAMCSICLLSDCQIEHIAVCASSDRGLVEQPPDSRGSCLWASNPFILTSILGHTTYEADSQGGLSNEVVHFICGAEARYTGSGVSTLMGAQHLLLLYQIIAYAALSVTDICNAICVQFTCLFRLQPRIPQLML